MASNALLTWLTCARSSGSGVVSVPLPLVSTTRTFSSRCCAVSKRSLAVCADATAHTDSHTAIAAMVTRARALAKLRIHFLEILAADEHLARLSATRRRDQAFGLHHVNQARRAAEAN